MSRLESAVRGGETDWRLVALEMSMAQRLARLEAAVRPGETERRLASLEEAVGQSLAELRASVTRLQDVTVSGLDDLREASTAAEVGILERIVAESQVVGARFEAVRPVVDVVARTHPELELAAAELRRLAATSPSPPDEAEADGAETDAAEADAADWSGTEVANPFPRGEDTAEEGDNEIFLPPEETPIPERRMRSLLPRRFER
jgi:hypothetical protein